jgi:hypothetical protein
MALLHCRSTLVVPADWITGGISSLSDSEVTALLSRPDLLSPAGPDTVGAGSTDQTTSRQPSHGHRSVSNTSNSDRNSSSRGASSARSTSYAHARPGHALHAASGRTQATSSNPRTSSVGSSSSSSNAAAGIHNARSPDTQDGLAASANNIGRLSSELLALNIAAELREIGVCSQHCQCAGFTSSKLQHLQSVLNEGHSLLPLSATSEQSLVAKLECGFLPPLAAKLFDPAGKHKLVAVQEALSEFHKWQSRLRRGPKASWRVPAQKRLIVRQQQQPSCCGSWGPHKAV